MGEGFFRKVKTMKASQLACHELLGYSSDDLIIVEKEGED